MNLKKLETLCNFERYQCKEDIETLLRMSVGIDFIVDWSRWPDKYTLLKFKVYADVMRSAIKNELKET